MASLFLRKNNKTGSKIWYIKWYENGIARIISTGKKSKTEANEFFRQFRPELSSNKDLRLKDLERKTLEYARVNVSSKTYSQYEAVMKNLIEFLQNEKLCHISKTDLQNFIAVRKKAISPVTGRQYSPYSLNIEIAILKKSFSIAEEKEWIIKNPAKVIKKFKVKSDVPAFAADDLKKFLELVQSNTKNIHYYYAILLGLYTGMRKGEISTLKWSQIDFNNSRLKLYNKITKESEYAYYNSEAAAIFNELKKSNVISAEGYIWGKPLNQRNLTRTFNYWRDKLGLPAKLRFHSTRHTAITRWANSLPFHVAQDLARHHSPAMTKRYIHTREEQLKKAINEEIS